MKVTKNTQHNSLELDFNGVKPSDEVRKLLKAYGFWYFMKEKKWCHSLEVDGDFFEDFVETRIKPLIAVPTPTTEAIESAVAAMSEEEKQSLLAKLMGK